MVVVGFGGGMRSAGDGKIGSEYQDVVAWMISVTSPPA
jgi:hypothetical protein